MADQQYRSGVVPGPVANVLSNASMARSQVGHGQDAAAGRIVSSSGAPRSGFDSVYRSDVAGAIRQQGRGVQGNGVRNIKLQPWITLLGSSTGADVIQPASQWVDGHAMKIIELKVDVLAVSGCTLVLESSETVEGPWVTATSITTASLQHTILSSDGAQSSFSRYLRWRVEKPAADWDICFGITSTTGNR